MNYLLQHYLERSAEQSPERRALVCGGVELTYRELNSRTDAFALGLRRRGVCRRDRIALLMHKTVEPIIAMLGVLKADAVYVPLDCNSPVSRLGQIIGDADPVLVIHDQASAGKAAELAAASGGSHTRYVAFSDLADTVITDGVRGRYANLSSDIAHILYTSGSTGKPKGVMISHANVRNYVDWAVEYFDIGSEDRMSNHSPFFFDLSMFDVYGSLAAGATLYPVPEEIGMLPGKIAEFIEQNQLTIWFSVPSLLVYMARTRVLDRERMQTLRAVLFCGEVFPVKYLRCWMEVYPEKRFYNLYGPTEATIACTCYAVEKLPESDDETLPIGTPCANTELLCLDEQDRLCTDGAVGELCVRGPAVSPGYWRNPEKNEEAFVRHPDNPLFHEKIYRTGDLGYQLAEGIFAFVGRKDTQVKVMGYRIELGEIEAALYAHAAVAEAVVLAFAEPDAGTELVGFVALHGDAETDSGTLKQFLATRLPRYMVPRRLYFVKELPKTGNNKVDRVEIKRRFIAQEFA